MQPLRRSAPLLIVAALLAAAPLSAQDTGSPAAPAAAVAPAAATGETEISLATCIARALERNFDIEISRYTPQIAKDGIAVAKDPYQPVLSATASRSHTRNLTPGIVTDGTNTSVGVSQYLYTGTSVGLSSNLNRSRVDPSLSALNPAYDADLTLSVRQQLLKGFGVAANKAAVKAAEAGFQIAELDYKARVLDVVQSTENAYFSLVFATEQLAVHEASLKLAQVLYDEAVNRKNVGVVTELDVFTANVAVQTARRQVLLDQQSLQNSREGLLAIIGRFEFDTPVKPAKLPEIEKTLPLLASSLNLARQSQPDYLAAVASVEQARLGLVTAKNNARPSLSVGGAVGLSGERRNSSDAFQAALDQKGSSWQVDLSLTYPWGRLGDRARYRQSLAAYNQTQARLRQTEQNIEVQVRSAVRAVETNHESVRISAEATMLAERQYELQKAKFDAGLATSREVLQSQTDLETARLNELQSRISLRVSIAALHRIEGSSLQRYGLALP
jgi:outer membrane protein